MSQISQKFSEVSYKPGNTLNWSLYYVKVGLMYPEMVILVN